MNQIAFESTQITINQKKAARIINYIRKSFDNIVINTPAFDPAILQNNPVMFVSTHRSHADYFILGVVAYEMGFRRLRFAAGSNLTRLPHIGPWFVSLGAFTVDRERSANRSYVRDLCDSVTGILTRNSHVIVFPEGGRSYKGLMLECKHGMIGAAIMAQLADLKKPVYYIPVTISYEHFPELAYFNILTRGKNLRKNASNPIARIWGNILYFGADLLALIGFLYNHQRKKHYGTVYLDFDRPFAVSELTDIAANINNGARDPFLAHRRSMQQVSETIHRKFLALYRLLPHHLVAAILEQDHNATRLQIAQRIPALLARLKLSGRNIQAFEKVPAETLMKNGIRQLAAHGAITEQDSSLCLRDYSVCSYFAAACKPLLPEG